MKKLIRRWLGLESELLTLKGMDFEMSVELDDVSHRLARIEAKLRERDES